LSSEGLPEAEKDEKRIEVTLGEDLMVRGSPGKVKAHRKMPEANPEPGPDRELDRVFEGVHGVTDTADIEEDDGTDLFAEGQPTEFEAPLEETRGTDGYSLAIGLFAGLAIEGEPPSTKAAHAPGATPEEANTNRSALAVEALRPGACRANGEPEVARERQEIAEVEPSQEPGAVTDRGHR